MSYIPYQKIAYDINRSFLDENIAKSYLHLKEKLDSINIEEISLIDKIFVVMCLSCRHSSFAVTKELKYEYNIEVSDDDVFHILLECQCSDIEITAMAKAFLYYDFSMSEILDEQIDYINKNGKIDLPYTYKFTSIES